MDSPYAQRMPALLRKVAEGIKQRGHRIGFHPGYETFNDEREWRRQRDGLENVIGYSVREGRQHVLRYQVDRTPDIWDAAGMEYECTLAFPEHIGFRSGTCRPFRAYSLVQRKALSLWQCATAVMDFSLFGGKYRDLSIDAALDECAPVIDACRYYGGELVILYHTGQAEGIQRGFLDVLLAEVA